jgi:hypothetical protein
MVPFAARKWRQFNGKSAKPELVFPRHALERNDYFFESSSRSSLLVNHDLFSENRYPIIDIVAQTTGALVSNYGRR